MLLKEFEQLKNPEIFKIIIDNLDVPSHKLSFLLNKFEGLPHRAIAEQVSCYQKANKKIPSFINKLLLFDKIALEQASSEYTAQYKSSLIAGNKLIDLTGGLGIDDVYFSNSFKHVTYCELNKITSKLFEYNITKLKISNITVCNSNSIQYLSEHATNNSFDWIYIDPARRDENRRSVDLAYCAPNVYDNIDLFFKNSENIMIKVAPAYDLTEAVRRFPNLIEIHVVSLEGECKEVLLILNKKSKHINPKIVAVALNSKNKKTQTFTDRFNSDREQNISKIISYFYEPDCAIIKSNLTPLLANKLGFSFINKLTPYLTSSEIIHNFPGRSFTIIDSLSYNEKEIKKYIKINGIAKANIARRDFKLSVNEIRKKLKLKDGGDIYLFFTSNFNRENIMIVTKKVVRK